MNELVLEVLNTNDFRSNKVIFMTKITGITLCKITACSEKCRQIKNCTCSINVLKT